MDSKKEYDRLLGNPDHVILSDDLQDILSDEDEAAHESDTVRSEQSYLIFKGEDVIFQVSKIKKIASQVFMFTGFSPNFLSKSFIEGEEFKLKIFDSLFHLEEGCPVEYRANGTLTFTARRIFKNEEV